MKKARSNYEFQDIYVQHYIHSNTQKDTTVFTIPLDTTYLWENNQMLPEEEPADELDKNNQNNSKHCWGVPVLCYSHIPQNVNSTKLTDGGKEKYKNIYRKIDKSIFKLQRDTYRCSNIIQKEQNDSPHIFGCIPHIRHRGTKQSRWIVFLGPKSNTPIHALAHFTGAFIVLACWTLVSGKKSTCSASCLCA